MTFALNWPWYSFRPESITFKCREMNIKKTNKKKTYMSERKCGQSRPTVNQSSLNYCTWHWARLCVRLKSHDLTCLICAVMVNYTFAEVVSPGSWCTGAQRHQQTWDVMLKRKIHLSLLLIRLLIIKKKKTQQQQHNNLHSTLQTHVQCGKQLPCCSILLFYSFLLLE